MLWRSRANARSRTRPRRRSSPSHPVEKCAREFLHRPLAAVETASTNNHRVLPTDYRGAVEVEGYGKVTIADDIAVRRGPINREIARLDGGWVCRITEIDRELRWRSAHNSTSTGGNWSQYNREEV